MSLEFVILCNQAMIIYGLENSYWLQGCIESLKMLWQQKSFRMFATKIT